MLGSPDVIEELLLLGALDGKVVIGSMNRGGLDGAVWTMDDRFTGYDAESIERFGLQGGKMLLRIDNSDPGVAATIQACAHAVTELADRRSDRDGRATAVLIWLQWVTSAAQGCRVAGPGRYRCLGARHLECLHLAEDARV